MAYCTTDEVLQRMGHPGAISADLLAKIADAILAAQSMIDQDTDRTFEPSTRTILFAAEFTNELLVPDLVSVTTVSVDDDDDGVFETEIDASGYELLTTHVSQAGWPYEVVRLLDRSWPCGGRRLQRIEIVGSWGWSAVPAAINQACSLMAARIAQRPSTALFGTQSFGDLGAAPIRSLDPDYRNLIGPYTKPKVA